VEAYLALRLAGDPADAQHMRAAASVIRSLGGLAAARVFTRIWLALLGLWPWSALPVLPPELTFLPRWAPLNIYSWACWARQTIVPLSVVCSHRPVRPCGVRIDELGVGEPAASALTRVLHGYERRPIHWLRRRAIRRAVGWILDRQEADGSWGGIQPPWVYSILALHVSGYRLNDPVLDRALRGLDRFTVVADGPGGPVRRLEACQSPVWDTALAVIALTDAGVGADDDAVQRAAEWLAAEQITVRGDWSVRRRALSPGGWAFEFDNDGYPDVDDTAEVVLALRRAGAPDSVCARGVDWALGMQSRSGGWAAFDADNTSRLPARLPFCDFGAVTDPPSADVTAHMLEMLAGERLSADSLARVRRGVDWLLAAQEPDGSWFGRWGANHIYGTGAAVPALVAQGISRSAPVVARAVSWLEGRQNPDGGWGEDLRSYRDGAFVGRGPSTPSQTAWALLALLAAAPESPAVVRGVGYLLRTQRDDGSWDEPYFTGTGFPGDFYINYHLYRLVFPLSALGRYRRMS
jgi:squalene-hopene/tetraprenyl-beta-curcumene cyclase